MAIKLRVSKDKILDGLQRVLNIVSSRTTLPILSNVLLQADKDGLHLSTTDFEVAIKTKIEAEVVKVGATTLPARKLFTILKEMEASEIEMEVDDKNAASIRCGSSFFKVLGLPDEEFPRFPQVPDGKELKLPQSTLRRLLRQTSYAASADETRYVLNGVFMSFKAEKLTVVATDGRRLALAESEVEIPKGAESDFILPTKAVVELERLLSDSSDLFLAGGENQLIVNLGGTILVTKLIEGTYPNFRQVIPSEAKERILLDREKFLGALHRAAILTSEKQQSVKLQFCRDALTITATTPDVGESKETLALSYKGKDLGIAFNPHYLMEPLRHLDADEIFLELTDEMSPGVVKINGPFLYVLMPMRMG